MLYAVYNRQNSVVDKIRAARNDAEELQSVQYFSGANLGLKLTTGSVSPTVSVPAFSTRYTEVTFTYDNHPGQYAQLIYLPTSNVDLTFAVYASPDNVTTRTKRSWVIETFNYSFTTAHSTSFYASVICTDTGVITYA